VVAVLEEFFRHNLRANLALVDFCTRLTPEQLAVQAPGAIYGAHGCLIHAVYNEESYLKTITGEDFDLPPWVPGEPPTLPELRRRFEATGERAIRVVRELREEQTAVIGWLPEPVTVPAYLPLVVLVTHSAEHREQARACLTLAGLQPPAIDPWRRAALGGR
jgi:uncharacterized damage-inducible protein DinB